MLHALAAAFRFLILARLVEGRCASTGPGERGGRGAVGLLPRLPLLRILGLMTGTRRGRFVVYARYGNHGVGLLGAALCHVKHCRLGVPGARAERDDGCCEADRSAR
ncbi:transcriptional regulator [Streptomyces sp. NPDC048419]|uniref:transcriptional regulator n=1 Tax=Streptomyces sp. NPDC048419 TaxID=3365547 RepID=UPI00371AB4E8